MSESNTQVADTTIEAIRQWLTERVAFYLELPESEIDPDAGLIEMGLDSVYAMTLSGDVEEQFELMVEPTLAWDHRTVNALATFLSAELAKR